MVKTSRRKHECSNATYRRGLDLPLEIRSSPSSLRLSSTSCVGRWCGSFCRGHRRLHVLIDVWKDSHFLLTRLDANPAPARTLGEEVRDAHQDRLSHRSACPAGTKDLLENVLGCSTNVLWDGHAAPSILVPSYELPCPVLACSSNCISGKGERCTEQVNT